MKFPKLIFFLCTVSIVALCSCDCYFEYEFRIYNNTTQLLKVEYSLNSEFRTVTIEPNEFGLLGTTDGFRCDCSDCEGGRINGVDSSMHHITGMRIFIHDTIETKTDFNNEYNWDFESAKSLGKYTAIVDSSDFEP